MPPTAMRACVRTAGTKKQSMFSVPEGVNSKVGVIGSGQGMTEYKGRARHEYAEAEDAD